MVLRKHPALARKFLKHAILHLRLGDNVVGRDLLMKGERGRLKELKALLGERVTDFECRDDNGQTALSRAAECGHADIVQFLLDQDKSVDADSKDQGGRTALSRAAEHSQKEVVKLLLASGRVDPDSEDQNGRTPLSWALGTLEDSLRARRLPIDASEVVELFLGEKNVNYDFKDYNGRTPLSRAAEYGYLPLFEIPLEQENVDPSSTDFEGRTPLSWAIDNPWNSNRKDTNALAVLIQHSGNILQMKDKYGQTPLSRAVENGCEEVVNLLLSEKSVDPDSKDNNGRTPLSLASYRGYQNIVQILLKRRSVEPDSRDNNHRTPLSWAAEAGEVHVVRQLLARATVDPNSRDNTNRTPLSWAVEAGEMHVVRELLVKDGVDPEPMDNEGHTPLSNAVKDKRDAIVALLAPKDKTTLHIFVQMGDLTSTKVLLEKDYDVDTKDLHDRTPLHIATSLGHLGIAKELISSGADVNVGDINALTPLRIAIQLKHRELGRLLLESSALTTGILLEDLIDTYEVKPADPVLETVQTEDGKTSVQLVRGDLAQSLIGQERLKHLSLFRDFSVWCRNLPCSPQQLYQLDKSRLIHRIQAHGRRVSIFVVGHFPTTKESNVEKFAISSWEACGIAWSMSPLLVPQNGSYWKPLTQSGTLPYAWMPEDGAEIFALFFRHLRERWLALCIVAEEHLSIRRLDQLSAKGNSSKLIHGLAEDAQEWAKLRNVLRSQVATAKEFVQEFSRRYDHGRDSMTMGYEIDHFDAEITNQINQLDQTVKDLLHFEFAWVSINEAHRSTSIATSIKRLSWITFIFLPAMFASSLFGMNVDILANNPDWRWYLLFGGACLLLTVLVWLFFKYGQIEKLVERIFGTRLQEWSERARGYMWQQKKRPSTLPA